MTTIETERLVLRNWKESDYEPFYKMCSDRDVMRYFPGLLSREESHAMARRIQSLIDERGWGLWAVEVPGISDFIGFTGLHIPKQSLPVYPCIEVGWRLAGQYWGNEYATEAARASLNYGFTTLDLKEIVSFTAEINTPSIAVMRRLEMKDTKLGFDHPDIPDGSPLKRHVLYKITHSEFHSQE